MSESKERKCIGVLLSNPNNEYQSDLLNGIYKAAFESDMNAAVFCNVELDREAEIVSLPDYDRLAGVIYVPYTFDSEDMNGLILPRLKEAVRAKNFPAVMLDKEEDGFASVLCDDSETVRNIVEHVITEHGCKDIAFLTGPKGHMHAESRLEVFLKVMEEHGLPVAEGRTDYGDFWYNYGRVFVENLINSEKGLPEAIICANSSMGYCVYNVLFEKHIYAPKDIILACYSDSSDLYTFITGAVKQVENAGYSAAQRLIGMINGKPDDGHTDRVKCGCKMHCAVTCGCIAAHEYNLSFLIGSVTHSKDTYMSNYNNISTDLLNRKSYRELFWGIDWYSFFLKDTAGVYFCLNEGWDKPDFSDGENKRCGYTDRMNLYYCRRNYPDGTHKSFFDGREHFEKGKMLPQIFNGEGKPSSFIFRSLNSPDKCFGYMVIDNGDRMQTYIPEFNYWLKDVTNALEAQYRILNMRYLSSYDLMTGIYNRNGFNNMMPEMIHKAAADGSRFFIALFDMNGMKYINDNYGHIEGDTSIKTAADIISRCRLNGADDERNFRIGGDEFVKAAFGNFTEDDIAELRKEFERCVKDNNANSGKPYPLYISAGICVKSAGDSFTLDSVLSEADKEMFRDKERIRKLTGFDPKRK